MCNTHEALASSQLLERNLDRLDAGPADPHNDRDHQDCHFSLLKFRYLLLSIIRHVFFAKNIKAYA